MTPRFVPVSHYASDVERWHGLPLDEASLPGHLSVARLAGKRRVSRSASADDVPRGTMDEASPLGLLRRSPCHAIKPRVRLCRLVLLIPCWENQGVHLEEKRGPASASRQGGKPI
jgi:hypothetical protein